MSHPNQNQSSQIQANHHSKNFYFFLLILFVIMVLNGFFYWIAMKNPPELIDPKQIKQEIKQEIKK